MRTHVGGLRSRAAEVAGGEGMPVGNGVVEFDDAVVAVVVVAAVGKIVVRRGRTGAGRGGPNGQQVLGNGVVRDAVTGENIASGSRPRVRGDRIEERVVRDRK